ncbi:hypothetical protein DSAG12_03652 [Promethearchaeum syntrophicum]|uniref:Uncharacterized protein n=1 Tax=Promethearchaeum syntrophicum TaxID=2594042 RepID=A0A5B9DFA1_9ARCH|nr:hypothetical protein [Candidatus Prometheoarchaeum syntrophicum]QEE17814.1 hypothetical protein DSAG12_03652 [Candidatus Prometheoarchaeum syntrophicum]
MNPKSTAEKVEFAKQLVKLGLPYREIQEELKRNFGTGMSNTTLQKIGAQETEIAELKIRLAQTTNELELYKRLYYEIVEAMKDKIK